MNFAPEIVTEKFAFKDTDFRVQLTNIKAANADAVIVTSASNSSGLPASIEQYRQADIKAPFVGAVGIMLPTVYKMAGDANNGIVSSDIYFSNLPPFTAIPENIAFVEAYKKAHGVEPAKSAALGAAALQVWARAVEQTKSLDRKTVAEAIRGKTITGTLFGDATFLPNGQLKPRFVMFKVVDGKNATLEALQ
jgi:branched-chain amino acid transport system substrate-binding protein